MSKKTLLNLAKAVCLVKNNKDDWKLFFTYGNIGVCDYTLSRCVKNG